MMIWIGTIIVLAAAVVSIEGATFASDLKPFLERYCTSCHGNEKQKGELNLQAFGDSPVFLQSRKIWEKVIEQVETREMPPEGKPQPSEDERMFILSFIKGELAKLDCNGPVNPGKVTIRRLNRNEYNNTIRDLVGVAFKPAADFPADEVGYGFDNIGDVLSLPPMLMEKYLAAAEQIATNAIVAADPSRAPLKRVEAEVLPSTANGSLFQDRALSLDTEGEAYFEQNFARAGEYIVRVRAFGQQAGPDPTRLAVRVDDKQVTVFDVAAVESKPGSYEWRSSFELGKRKLGFAYINNYNVQDHPDPKLRGDRNLIVDYIEIEGPFGGEPLPLPESHRRIVSCPVGHRHTAECGKRILGEFARKAYRRPVTDEEVNRLTRFVDLAKAEGGTFEEGIQVAVQAVLVSPHFLYRWELDPELGNPDKTRSLNNYEIASRLSYYLWSSLPDNELFILAEQGLLTQPPVLESQVKRMLKDSKSQALVENFAAQWLQIRNLELAAPDPNLFPQFDNALRASMRRETELFFEHVMREDRSLLDLIDAKYTFVNERLARHYGLEGIQGEEFQKVSLKPGDPRGGVLTQASILTITSNPTRTSPVNRGKWILEQILGTPPPPPPPDAGQLSEDKESIESASLRQRVEQHRAKTECATCHNKMDPLGFAFENFDAVGAWRELDGKFPIDPSGTLPSGQMFQGPGDLKKILKSQQTFVRSLSEKMLTFALGRGLEYYDKCAVDDIVAGLIRDDYRFSTLVSEIVKSDPFLLRTREGNTK